MRACDAKLAVKFDLIRRTIAGCRRCKGILASQIEAMVDHDYGEDRTILAIDRIRAGGVIKSPSRTNVNIVTSCRSRLSVTSQRMVASDPATDKFGPRSTPISTALETCAGT